MAAPDATETILWKTLSYHDAVRGGKVKGAVCQISLHADHVRLSFIHGAALPDPSGILRGDRQVKAFRQNQNHGGGGGASPGTVIRAAAERTANW